MAGASGAVIEARVVRSRRIPQQTHYYCAGEGCGRNHQFALLVVNRLPDTGKIVGDLRAGYNFKLVEGIWELSSVPIRERGRTVAHNRAFAMDYLKRHPDLKLAPVNFTNDMKRPLARCQLDKGPQYFRCPDCTAINAIRTPAQLALIPDGLKPEATPHIL